MLIALNEKAHTTTSRSRFTLFRLTVECWDYSTQVILQPVASLKLFSHKTLRSTILQRKWCQQQRTEFFNFLQLSIHGSHRFVVTPSPNLISYPVKNSKFQVVCCFSRRKYQPTKKPVCYNSDKCWAMKSVESWIWKIVRIFSQILYCRWSQLFLTFAPAIRADIFPLKISLFSNSKSKKSNEIRKSYVSRALRFSCQGPTD